jgi:hypothetical protein
MNPNPLDITILALATFLLGVIIGILFTGFRANHKVNQAYEASKKEFDEEKARLAVDVGEQLGRMRVGLKQSVDAYESTLRVLATRLPLAEHGLGQLEGIEPLHLTHSPEIRPIQNGKASQNGEEMNPETTEAPSPSDPAVDKSRADLATESTKTDSRGSAPDTAPLGEARGPTAIEI